MSPSQKSEEHCRSKASPLVRESAWDVVWQYKIILNRLVTGTALRADVFRIVAIPERPAALLTAAPIGLMRSILRQGRMRQEQVEPCGLMLDPCGIEAAVVSAIRANRRALRGATPVPLILLIWATECSRTQFRSEASWMPLRWHIQPELREEPRMAILGEAIVAPREIMKYFGTVLLVPRGDTDNLRSCAALM